MKITFIDFFKHSVNRTFLVFSCIFFLAVSLAAVTAFSISTRQINLSYVEQQLAIASETIRLRLASAVNSELALVLKMADTPAIRQHFLSPSNPGLKSSALVEFETYLRHFDQKTIFWISDIDKIFYSTTNEPYLLDPDDPDFYWYNLTLYNTEKYNFNINYNPTMRQINLWVNVPVFRENENSPDSGGRKPLGMLGTGINLTVFSDFIVNAYKEFDGNITPYTFNKYNEITSAADYHLVNNKVRLDDHLGDTGKEIVKIAAMLSDGEEKSFIYNGNIFLVNSIPEMEWYLTVSYPLPGFLAINQSINTIFFSMLFLILFALIVLNVFVVRSENAIAKRNIQLIEANKKAETASHVKSEFLAKMSHEIRTPMNAITGMTELVLRRDLSNEARNEIKDIRQAGKNLLSIINDILDLSKIESGKLEIVPVNYLLASLINDTVNIIRMRMQEKPIRLFTNIDSSIPCSLIGDEVRLRQILLNLISNAVKFTTRGYVSMTITAHKREENNIWLKISIADTGKGIKQEDQAKLFNDFVQVDKDYLFNAEGTGLGLSITKRLCAAMGGSISLESEYGKGSEFTVIIPQLINSSKPFAAVENAEKKKVLVYERRKVYADSMHWSLENMNVPHEITGKYSDFCEALKREEWFYVFSGYGFYEKVKPAFENLPYERKPPLALLIEWGTEDFIPNTCFLSIPVQSISIANVLNGKRDNTEYNESSSLSGYIYPGARLLVVDDILTNLKVAEGLLVSYKAVVDTCQSGQEAIEAVKQNDYDLVFMDHMMPEMDGIEAAAVIRKWEEEHSSSGRKVPIIALTANAVVGMKEMFLEKGFSGFLSKPIDISKLDEILDAWLPAEKRRKDTEPQKSVVSADGNSAAANDADSSQGKKKLIILVDDNPANLRIGKNVLMEKYMVSTAPSAEKLFEILKINIPDMILLDIDMPDMDGYETIKILKSRSETKDIPVIFLTGKTDTCDELDGLSLGAIDYITKPFQPLLLLKRIDMHLLVESQKNKLEKLTSDLMNYSDNLQKMVWEKTQNITELQDVLLKTMAEMVEYRDDITGGHIERTQNIVKVLLEEIIKNNIFSDETRGLKVDLVLQSCQLHDVGKISIEDRILKKPGKLTEEEFNQMKKHSDYGREIIEKIEGMTKENDFLKYAKIFAATHHEKWDGTGYPAGLKGKDIPLLGRIMAIADVYDALTSVRPYKEAFSHDEAVKIITDSSASHFDPDVVAVFLKAAEQFRIS